MSKKSKRICPKCNIECDKNVIFCIKCGTQTEWGCCIKSTGKYICENCDKWFNSTEIEKMGDFILCPDCLKEYEKIK